jgi:hypothetical protein
MIRRTRIRIALIAFALALSPGISGRSIAAPATTAKPAPEQPPFARVYLALRGCTSCAHCRTSILQMVRSNAKGGEATFGEDRVEVRYPRPSSVPLREVIHSLAQSRLHDLSVVDVLFEATGTVSVAKDGSRRFVIDQTGQTFPMEVAGGVWAPGPGHGRLTAVVQGWRGKGSISLVPRELKGA